ncbi:hypothetical protein [Paenibacillus qinlingensis]|nr:hypothetical protein [Paenibacillus qinlingensis]NQX60021.1 hypothetical protein [Paenibacillus qinlingensis]
MNVLMCGESWSSRNKRATQQFIDKYTKLVEENHLMGLFTADKTEGSYLY